MSFEFVLLGLLAMRPYSGYDLRKWMEVEGQFSIPDASQPDLPVVSRMVTDGWIEFEVDPRAGRPDAKVYRLTDKGRQVLLDWARSPYEPTSRFQDADFLARFTFAGAVDRDAALALVRTELAYRREQVAKGRARDRIMRFEDPVPELDAERTAAIFAWSHHYGATAVDAWMAWLERTASLGNGKLLHGRGSDMKAIMVMFDSLNRRFLPPYSRRIGLGARTELRPIGRTDGDVRQLLRREHALHPARREMHTGRYNFLHRSWGPLEPFDDSVPEMLKNSGVYTHLVTDHQHYWEDGGATFHNRYNTYEFFRGQEGDAWKGHVADPEIPDGPKMMRHGLLRQDVINRQYLADEADHPQTRVFDAGLEFLGTNRDQDNWFLQIECFDPHEPFFSHSDHKKHYDSDYQGPHFDWPDPKKVDEAPEVVQHAREEYAALLTMCDASLGRVMDFMDRNDMWQDTLLIVCTDHGFLLV